MNEQNQKTILTEYFKMNQIDPEACKYLYREFPPYYVWNKTAKKWAKHQKGNIIGRIYAVNPSEG